MQGWECPKCGKCYAPHVDECKQCGDQAGDTIPVLPNAPIYPTQPIWLVPYWDGWYTNRPYWERYIITCGASTSVLTSGTLNLGNATGAHYSGSAVKPQ